MLKEQLLGFAVKALSRAYETKKRIRNSLRIKEAQKYVDQIKGQALSMLDKQWQKFLVPKKQFEETSDSSFLKKRESTSLPNKNRALSAKIRKSSIRPAKEIISTKADIILQRLKNNSSCLVKKNETVNGKISLAYLLWAFGQAEKAGILEGLSIHDVSALLYRAGKIELYPINVSRVVHGNPALIKQVGQEKRTKTYLLTQDGKALFQAKAW